MIFSKTTEYAFRIMSFMAVDEKKLHTANEIFENLDIPFRYLRKLMLLLSKSSLVNSVQGKHGGYKIAKKLSNISLIDIIRVVGDDKIDSPCFFGFVNCAFTRKCKMHDKWAAIQSDIREVLNTTTLKDLKENGPHRFLQTHFNNN